MKHFDFNLNFYRIFHDLSVKFKRNDPEVIIKDFSKNKERINIPSNSKGF